MSSDQWLFGFFAAGFEKTFGEFTKKQEQRDMALLEKLQTLADNDEVIKTALAEQQQVAEGFAAQLQESNNSKDAQIKDLLAQVAAGEKTLADAEAIVDQIAAKRAEEVKAISDIFTPKSAEPVEQPAPEPTV